MQLTYIKNLPDFLEADIILTVNQLKKGDLFITYGNSEADDPTIIEYLGANDIGGHKIKYYYVSSMNNIRTNPHWVPGKGFKVIRLKQSTLEDVPDLNRIAKYSAIGICATFALAFGLSLFNGNAHE